MELKFRSVLFEWKTVESTSRSKGDSRWQIGITARHALFKEARTRSRLPSRIASIAVHVIHWRVCSQANGGIVARLQLRGTIKIKVTHLIVKCYFRCGWHHGWAACAGRHGSHHKTHRILGAFDYLHSLVMGCVTEIVTINLRKNEKWSYNEG